ncbi:MAG: DUF4136 domain-containing protein, partial [Gemmatimonadaceae bacterium]|nr:DUF4136 domain-containing protein [Gemmatimonadaceae bacterium]
MRAARFAVLAFLLSGCAPAVRITRDAAIVIPPRATWSFGGKDGAYSVDEADPRARSDSVQHRVERAIAYELDRRGFKRADPTAATFLVHFHIGARTETVRVRSDDPATCVADECRNAWNWRG